MLLADSNFLHGPFVASPLVGDFFSAYRNEIRERSVTDDATRAYTAVSGSWFLVSELKQEIRRNPNAADL